MNSNALTPIPVPGTDQPLLATEVNGAPMVAFRPLCEALGIAADSQLVKLKGRSWARTTLSVVRHSDGRNREMTFIDRRTMTMWLATLNENRVSDDARPTVIAYQSDAADALDAHFHGHHEVQPRNQFDVMRAMVDSIESAQRSADEAKAIASNVDDRLTAIEGRHDWYAALGYARKIKCANTSTGFLNSVGRQAASIARHHGIEPVKVPHALYGEVNSLPAWIWEQAFEGRAA